MWAGDDSAVQSAVSWRGAWASSGVSFAHQLCLKLLQREPFVRTTLPGGDELCGADGVCCVGLTDSSAELFVCANHSLTERDGGCRVIE